MNEKLTVVIDKVHK